MSNVIVDKTKIDLLANAISAKTGENLTLTLDEMVEAVDGIKEPIYQAKSVTIYPTEAQQTAAVTPGSEYDALSKVDVTVEAVSGSYVGSNIPRRNSSNLSVSGRTVTAAAGYYSNGASKSIAQGTAGTPTATKGTVSNNSISVTPSVTNTTGYITGGTKTGTAVTVSASELVSGDLPITQNGSSINCVNYATVSVSVPSSGGSVTQDQDGYIIIPSTGGGSSGGDAWAWYGTNATLLNSSVDTVALEDTDFATWTPSTTATNIWEKQITSSVPAGQQALVVGVFEFNPVYQTGTTVLSGGTKYVSCLTNSFYTYPSSVAQWQSGTSKSSATTYTKSTYYLFYINSSGTATVTNSNSGVFFNSATPPTLTATTQTSTFAVRAAANANNFSATMLAALDQEQSTFTLASYVYAIPPAYNDKQAQTDLLIDVYRNGISGGS